MRQQRAPLQLRATAHVLIAGWIVQHRRSSALRRLAAAQQVRWRADMLMSAEGIRNPRPRAANRGPRANYCSSTQSCCVPAELQTLRSTSAEPSNTAQEQSATDHDGAGGEGREPASCDMASHSASPRPSSDGGGRSSSESTTACGAGVGAAALGAPPAQQQPAPKQTEAGGPLAASLEVGLPSFSGVRLETDKAICSVRNGPRVVGPALWTKAPGVED